MNTNLYALLHGAVFLFEYSGKTVQLYAKENQFVVEFSVPNFPEPMKVFDNFSDAQRTYQWFTKSLKHGYL